MSTPFIGEIRIMAFNFAPRSWALCNGQLLPINQNQALFALLGTTYGGNGTTNFALPNLQGRSPMGFGASHPLGESSGEAAHTLTQNEIPQHLHELRGVSAPGTTFGPANGYFAAHRGGYAQALGTALAASSSAAGGSQPHENRPPYLGLNFCIALTGIFPSRN